MLPYAFARRHGVLLQHVQGRTICLHRVHTTSLALAEVQRVTEGELDFQDVPDDIFDARVSVVYRDDAVLASAAAGDAAGDGGGLGSLADTAAVGRLKEYRGIAMRCCKTDESFSAFIALAATVIRLR
ncbi:hypothetical protein [Paracoccus actinidiae]|uniref:hypothetical protein n=1 Tax=Paracoccus actinidiae TaxID=3064531 RepID=UPI0027D2A2DD|nr:hypothetical protein [Paracoccus sp. M09]